MKLRTYSFWIALIFLTACTDDRTNQSHGPIKLGDSATIVTESDPRYLKDYVPDLHPVMEKVEQPDEPTATKTETPAEDTAKSAETAANTTTATPAANTVNGLNVAFKEITLSIPGIAGRTYQKGDLQNARGASYELTSGTLAGNKLQASGGTVQKVTQRYQTVLSLKNGNDVLLLESLGNFSSAWEPLNGNNGVYPMANLEPAKLGFKDLKPAAIANAVQQAARRKRLDRKATQEWLNLTKTVKTTNAAPCAVVLRSVNWRITGKDAAGKTFNKELRIDIPMQ